MQEKCNVVEVGTELVEGRYRRVDGFGWSNAVFRDFARRLDHAARS